MTKFTQEVSDVIAMLEHENKLIRARNERREKEVEQLEQQTAKLEEELHACRGLRKAV